MKNKSSFALLVLIFIFCISISAQSKIKIRLGVTAGMSELLRKLFVELYKEAGVNAVIKELPVARIMNEFDKGTVDAVLFASDYAVKNRPRATEFTNGTTYTNYLIAYIHGNQAHENAILELGANPVPVPDYSNALNMLVTGRVDMILAVPGALADYFTLTGIDSKLVTMIQKPLASFKYYHILNQKYFTLAEALKKVFKKTQTQ